MKFKELLEIVSWEDIEESLLRNYSDVSGSMDGYRKVFDSLLGLTPVETKFRIGIREVFDFDDAPYADVFGRDGTLNKELPEFRSEDSEFAESEVEWAIEFRDWREWLGMEIEPIQNYSYPDIVAHCLWEMTFLGFDEATIQEQRNKLDQAVEEFNGMSKEELAQNLRK